MKRQRDGLTLGRLQILSNGVNAKKFGWLKRPYFILVTYKSAPSDSTLEMDG